MSDVVCSHKVPEQIRDTWRRLPSEEQPNLIGTTFKTWLISVEEPPFAWRHLYPKHPKDISLTLWEFGLRKFGNSEECRRQDCLLPLVLAYLRLRLARRDYGASVESRYDHFGGTAWMGWADKYDRSTEVDQFLNILRVAADRLNERLCDIMDPDEEGFWAEAEAAEQVEPRRGQG